MLPFPVSHWLPPAPTILDQGSTQTQGASQPFAFNYAAAAGSDAVAIWCAYGRNQDRTFAAATYGGVAMSALKSEDNGGTDRAGGAWFYLTRAAYESGGGTGWGTSKGFSVSCNEGNPDSWHGVPFSLKGVNQTTPLAIAGATSQSSGVAAKSVAQDTGAIGKNVLVLVGRTIARNAAVTFTPGTNVTELADTGLNSESIFVGKRDDMQPQNFSASCTASSAAFDGDAMAAVSFQG